MTVPIAAFIFDLDGVISDVSAEYHFRSWQRLAQEEGIPFTRQDNQQLLGVSRRECLTRFLNRRSIEEATALDWLRRKDAYFHEWLAQMQPDDHLPGVRTFLTEARELGLSLGLASASGNAHAVLEKLQMLDFFTIVGDANLAIRPKPAPDLYLWVAGYLRAPVDAAVVFEDSAPAIAAARSVGFWTVGIGVVETAHITVPDLRSVHVADILKAIPTLTR